MINIVWYGYVKVHMVKWLWVLCLSIVLCCVELGVWLWWVVGHRGEYVGVYLPLSQDTLQSRTLTQLAICKLRWRHYFHVQAVLRHVAQVVLQRVFFTRTMTRKLCWHASKVAGKCRGHVGDKCGQFVLDKRQNCGTVKHTIVHFFLDRHMPGML